MTDVRAEIIALIDRARGEGSKVIAIEALDRVVNDDTEFLLLLHGLGDTWDRTPPPADIRTPGWEATR